MKKELAKVVNQFFDQEALEAYVNYKLELIYKVMETAKLEQISHCQGQISELRNLLRAKEIALNVLMKEK